jgi:hypothetical protein
MFRVGSETGSETFLQVGSGSGSDHCSIPDPGSGGKKAPDPGSATLSQTHHFDALPVSGRYNETATTLSPIRSFTQYCAETKY